MAHVDLDAARAARAETRGDPNVATLGGRDWQLVAELPMDALVAYNTALRPIDNLSDVAVDVGAAREFIELVLADPAEADDFWKLRPSWADFRGLFGVFVPPDVTEGESSASQPSSPKGGKRSRPTSPRSTT